MSTNSNVVLSRVVASLLAAASTGAHAQEQPAGGSSAIEEIVVTAQRREETLERVPLAVTAVSSEQMIRLRINDIKGLAVVAPSMTFTSGISYAQLYIRGIGSSFTNPGLEPAVATYIDGAYLERGFGTAFDILDPGTIQILKGPQGTLWGRNSTGGALLINTADPEQQLGGHVTAEAGNYDHQRYEGVVNIPLSDTVAVRFAGRYSEDGGYVKNLADGMKYGGRENSTIRGKIGFTPNDAFEAVFQVQYDKTERSPGANSAYLPAEFCLMCSASQFTLPVTNPYTTVLNNIGRVGGEDESTFFNLRMQWVLGDFTLASTTGYRDTDNLEAGDFDFTELQVFNLVQYSGAKTLTEELSVSSDFDGKLNFIAGLSYLTDESYFNLGGFSDNKIPSYPLPPGIAFGNNTVDTDSISGFAEVTYEPIDGLKLIAGGRYTEDSRDLKGIEDDNWNSFTPRFVVSYDAGAVNLYASYNEGFKAGGFNTPAAAPPANTVEPEEIKSYEIGAKYLSDDGRLRANLAVFTYDYSNIQVTVIDQLNGGSVLQNAASAGGDGMELDVNFQAIDSLKLFGALSYLDTSYDDYKDAQVQVPVYDANGDPVGLAVGFEDLSGSPLVRAPDWSGFLGATWMTALGSTGWSGELTGLYSYNGGFDFAPGGGGPLRGDRQPSYSTAQLSGRVMPESGKYEIGFFVENLTDEEYYDFRFTTAPFGGMQYIARPRTYGIRLGYHF